MKKQFYLPIKGEKVPVSEETYRAYKQPVWKEKKRIQRETADGTIPLSLDKLIDDALANESEGRNGFDIPSDEDVEAAVCQQAILDALFEAIEELSEEEKVLIHDIFYMGKTEREIAASVGITQKAINKRKTKLLGKLSENEKLRKIYKNS